MSCETSFFRELREHGFRLTAQREMVLGVLHQIEGFATAEEVYQRVRTLSTAVDISTVYRTLDLLQEFHLVTCVEGNDGQRRYELLTDHAPHAHLVCANCGAVSGAELVVFQPLLDQLLARSGFAVDARHLYLSGLCRRCRVPSPAPAASGD